MIRKTAVLATTVLALGAATASAASQPAPTSAQAKAAFVKTTHADDYYISFAGCHAHGPVFMCQVSEKVNSHTSGVPGWEKAGQIHWKIFAENRGGRLRVWQDFSGKAKLHANA